VLVIAEGIGDSEDKRASFVCLFLDGRHSSFYIHHGVESETKITVKKTNSQNVWAQINSN